MQELASSSAILASPESATASEMRIGIVTECQADLDALISLLDSTNYTVVYSGLANQALPLAKDPELWLLKVGLGSQAMDELIDTLVQNDLPIVIDDAEDLVADRSAEYYLTKLDTAHGLQSMQSERSRTARDVWVLAASAGGPEAVIEFLCALELNPQVLRSSAFIYAQHIAEQALDNLIRALQRNTQLKVHRCSGGKVITAGEIYVLSPDSELDISESRSLNLTGRAWKGDYAPSISQILAKVGRVYRERAGAMIFSGMGNDGADALKLMKAMGAKVFVQSCDSCAVDSMPREALATGCVDYVGSPKQLAAEFLTLMQAQAC